ncbi:beta-arrestin-1-like isoform 1-T2 [Cochliomyia hominivorax]
MTENKDKHCDKDKDKKNEIEFDKDRERDHEKDKNQQQQQHTTTQKEQHDRPQIHKDDYGTQRVYKKTSPNCVLTMYLPSREITLSGNGPSVLRGIVFVDPKAIQGYRIYAQLTLTFRYGREDEEVMGLRFCNEAIMSLHQIWPRKEELSKENLSPLQEALLKRLGEGAHPFTLTLTAQAPPSVQLVPAKRYYGAPIGTSYDVRCFIADKTDEKFHRRASVKMGVRVIYRTDVFNHVIHGPENFAALVNNPVSSPPVTLACTNTHTTTTPPICSQAAEITTPAAVTTQEQQESINSEKHATDCNEARAAGKPRKSERGDSFPKLRLSPKTFRFSGRFGRSKSEVDKCSNDAFYNYSKSFQEYDNVCPMGCGGPQGAVDKPFLLQDGRVGLRASLDKAWYTHGEDVCVTINIRNDSRKTVRKIRVCAIQHVDVCMFNNGKFKNVVADSDNITPPPIDHHVAPGATLNTTIILKPQRGATKNWIALEDTLQRCTEPDEINATIAASAVKTPHFLMQVNHSPSNCTSPAVFIPPLPNTSTTTGNPTNDERNVFAIYVSYYVKVKLTLSGMGGELSLKLPFMLVHIDEEQKQLHEMQKLNLDDVPANRKNGQKCKNPLNKVESSHEFAVCNNLDRIESMDENNIKNALNRGRSKAEYEDEDDVMPSTSNGNGKRRPFKRSETLAKDLEPGTEEERENDEGVNKENKTEQLVQVVAQVHSNHHISKETKKEVTKHKRASKKKSNEMRLDDIQQISEKSGDKELTNTTTIKATSEASNTNV